ncbi:Predicted arabinose efflux permease, MFS family [Rathayibacter oskolensis]|uniref:Predicted arabinose efflux permease, MFS family n=1 Tax=Rathayibacter oskolensis TaxID=1891671 RepID=A0A1X7NX27_9MICO|nr:MFS transporter [Rathayibacter oskolensis]SMH42837.1 Predicted arabinose efflux permease, MFS family [Rathayibacter oskolensis]
MSSSPLRGTAGEADPVIDVPRTRSWLLVAPALIVLGWGGNHFLPLMQYYRQVEGFSQVQVDILLGTYVLGIVPGFALSGAWSDRYGRRPVLIVGLVLGILGSVVLAGSSSSFVGLCVGRFICGLSVAAGMVVGTSWIKELSIAEGWSTAGARRAAGMLTIGFGGGAGIGGALAQWGPWPAVLPYLVQIAACAVAVIVLLWASETRRFDPGAKRLLGNLRVPRTARSTFLRVVLPLAPWVFAAPALSFAVGPSLVSDRIPGFTVGFATLVTVITLGVGWVTQFFSGHLAKYLRGGMGLVGGSLIAAGALLLIPAASSHQVWIVLVAAPVFGAGYGLAMVSGLARAQALASPQDLAGITAAYYSLTYVGFLLPAALAALTSFAPMWILLGATAAACALCTAVAARGMRRDIALVSAS